MTGARICRDSSNCQLSAEGDLTMAAWIVIGVGTIIVVRLSHCHGPCVNPEYVTHSTRSIDSTASIASIGRA